MELLKEGSPFFEKGVSWVVFWEKVGMPHKLYNPFDYLFSTSIDKRCVMISSLFFVDVGVCLLFVERVANPFSKKVSLTYNATIAIVVTQ